MKLITFVAAAILIVLGLAGYFGGESRSFSALIPAFLGGVLLICGVIALKPNLLKHAIHAALGVCLLGFLGGAYRLFSKLGPMISGESGLERSTLYVLAMCIVCMGYIGLVFDPLSLRGGPDWQRKPNRATPNSKWPFEFVQ